MTGLGYAEVLIFCRNIVKVTVWTVIVGTQEVKHLYRR
jgi:hypothetical protein